MIETPARITRVDGSTAWVQVESPPSCGACGGRGCGASLYARMFHPREPEYPVDNAIGAQPGDAVVVGLADGALLKAVCAGYLAPLALLLAGALLGTTYGDAGAVAGAVTGFALAAWWLRGRRQSGQPAILRRGAPSCSTALH